MRQSAVENILLENIDKRDTLFIFPTNVSASLWADHLLRIKGGGTVAMNKFIAWDTFKENSVRSQVQKKKSIPSVLRKMFISGLIAENAELCRQGKKPVFHFLIREKWAQQAASFAGWMAELLPQLGAWFSSAARLHIGLINSPDAAQLAKDFDGDDRDLFTLGVRYSQFLDAQGLFEPAWEKPPFDNTGTKCFLFFPDCLRDYSEYRDLLENSGNVQAIYSTQILDSEKSHDFFHYTNSRSEISEAALYIRNLAENQNIRWDSISVSIPDAENYEPYVLREFRLRNIPFVKRTGKDLGSHPVGLFFSDAGKCVSRDFSLDAMNQLLLNNSLPWKETGKNLRLIDFGINNNCIASWVENEGGKERAINVWEDAFELHKDRTMEKGFFKDLKYRLVNLRNSSGFADIRKNYFIFREHFFDMEKCLPETDLILSRCISELGNLIDIEKSFPDVKVSDPYMFFVEYLDEVTYLAQQQESGVAILPYQTAAPAPFDYHIVIGASQDKISTIFSRLNFLPAWKRDRLGLKDEDASEILITLHKANSLKQAAFFCAENSFSGYAIPHSSLIKHSDIQAGETSKPLQRYRHIDEYQKSFCADLFEAENKLYAYSGATTETGPLKLWTAQKSGFLAWLARKKCDAKTSGQNRASENLLQLIRDRFCNDSGQMSVSASSLEKYYQCSLKWLYERVLKLESVSYETDLMPNTIAGSVYHAVLHEFLKAIKEKSEAFLPPALFNNQPTLPDTYQKILSESLGRVFDSFPFFPGKDEPDMKGSDTAGYTLHPSPTAPSAASREVSPPSIPHSLGHVCASTAATSLRSSISGLTARLLCAQKKQFSDNLSNFLGAFISYFAGCKVISTESHYSSSSQGAYILNGIVDCILETPSGENIIVDFKTKTMPAPDRCRGDSDGGLSDFQLPLYMKLFEAGEGNGKKIYTALFFSIISQLPQVLFGRIEDAINGIKYPKKDDDVILRDSGPFNSIMNQFNEKIEQFVAETQNGQFTNIEADYNLCLDCIYHGICRTVYKIGQEHNATVWGEGNGS